MQKNEIRPLPIPYTKSNSKWIKEPNVRPKTNTQKKTQDKSFMTLDLVMIFLDVTSKAQVTKEKKQTNWTS